MSVHDQEMMIKRTKEANEEIDGDERPETLSPDPVDRKEDGSGEDCSSRARRNE